MFKIFACNYCVHTIVIHKFKTKTKFVQVKHWIISCFIRLNFIFFLLAIQYFITIIEHLEYSNLFIEYFITINIMIIQKAFLDTLQDFSSLFYKI